MNKLLWVAMAIPKGEDLKHAPVPDELVVRSGWETTHEDWLRGIAVNARERISPTVPDDAISIALYQDQASTDIQPIILAGAPDHQIGHMQLVTYTPPSTRDVVSFMLGAWLCAWVPRDKLPEILAEVEVIRVEGKG